MQKFSFDHPALSGISYEELNMKTEKYLDETAPESLSGIEKSRYEFKKLNLYRVKRAHKIYKPGPEVTNVVEKINSPQLWMVLTEDWCGDSAQNLPYISMIAETNPNITLRILERDSYPEVMDSYLTNGSRSIPKLVAFDQDGNELFQWGPRPEPAKELVATLKAEGFTKEQFNEKLHLWYGRDRGKTVENELLELISESIDVESLSI